MKRLLLICIVILQATPSLCLPEISQAVADELGIPTYATPYPVFGLQVVATPDQITSNKKHITNPVVINR